jgi:hypothetical protein
LGKACYLGHCTQRQACYYSTEKIYVQPRGKLGARMLKEGKLVFEMLKKI